MPRTRWPCFSSCETELKITLSANRLTDFTSEEEKATLTAQVADLNALNAVLAVVKWKKIRGFYRDLEREHHCTYTTDGNMLITGDLA